MAEEKAATPEQKSKKGLIASIIAAVAVVVVVIVCVLCFGTPKVVGKYNLSAFIENGEESTSMVDLLKAFGGSYTVEFKKDKTGVLEMKAGDESQTIEFKWNDKELTAKNDETNEDESIPYEYKDDVVTLTWEGQGMKFKREGK